MQYVLLEKRGHIGLLTLNRPEVYNTLNVGMLNELERAATEIESDRDIRVLLITGAGKAFAAGADISEMLNLDKAGAAAFAETGNRAFKKIDDLLIPTIAVINGYALGGGCELALCCDIRIAAESAKIGQPEVTLGITPGFGGTQRLPRAVGTSNAMLLALTGKPVNAETALRMRLINEVHPNDQLMEAALALAKTIADNAPVAVRNCKNALSRRVDKFLTDDLNYETQVFSACFETADQKMAMQAFVQKQPKGEFKGE